MKTLKKLFNSIFFPKYKRKYRRRMKQREKEGIIELKKYADENPHIIKGELRKTIDRNYFNNLRSSSSATNHFNRE
jgi:hypothetical protein